MNLYLISRTDDWSYDEYDAILVSAENEESALEIPPTGDKSYFYGWTSKQNLKIEYIGVSNSSVEKVILASFNAG